LSLIVDNIVLHSTTDYDKYGIHLASNYHTKNLMSYDFSVKQIKFNIQYYLCNENSLCCLVSASGSHSGTVTLFATNIYGFVQNDYWGSDGVVSGIYNRNLDVSISKVWSYGDIFVIGADKKSTSHKSTSKIDVWDNWIYSKNLTSDDSIQTHTFPWEGGDSRENYESHSYTLDLSSGKDSILIVLSRGTNEKWAVDNFQSTKESALETLQQRLTDDSTFYKQAFQLHGDWPQEFKRGVVYDTETVRLTIRPPIGIYKHRWDGMQVSYSIFDKGLLLISLDLFTKTSSC
jgi:hypothetical protein